ncbi:MAG: hypothetical protein NZ534_11245, partial [Bacteroidia bacterium]|nr:hypothetical protein [Bacteroidia bacterium]
MTNNWAKILCGAALALSLCQTKAAAQCAGFNFTVSNEGLCPPLIIFTATGITNSDLCLNVMWRIVTPDGTVINHIGCEYFETLEFGSYNVSLQIYLPTGEVCTINRIVPIYPATLNLEPESIPGICTPSNTPTTFCIEACEQCPQCCTWIVSNESPVQGAGCVGVAPSTVGCRNLKVRYQPPNTGCLIERTFDCIVKVYPPCPTTFTNSGLDFCPGEPITVNFNANTNCGE